MAALILNGVKLDPTDAAYSNPTPTAFPPSEAFVDLTNRYEPEA